MASASRSARSRSPIYMYRPFLSIAHHVPAKIGRLLLVTCILMLGLVFYLHRHSQDVRRVPFQAPPPSSILVHGKPINDAPKSLYPLTPFPESPMQAPDDKHSGNKQQPWLAAVVSAAWEVERRMIIRSTWMRLYRDLPMDTRFVVSNPGPQWTDTVAYENRTFGDMIVLDNLQEDDITANTVKTLEFLKWLTTHSQKYEFVTKLDTDSWLNARGFWDRFLEPRMSNTTTGHAIAAAVDRTVIGDLYVSPGEDLAFPHGSMYTMTWDMVELFVRLQDKFHVVAGEDMALGILMLKGGERADLVNFRGTEKFDYDDRDARGDSTAWARQNTHPDATKHAVVGKDAITVHQLKDEKLWFKVADCFDEKGVKDTPAPTEPDRAPPFSLWWLDFKEWAGFGNPFRTRFDRIPEFFWERDGGKWICFGIWNLGSTKEGYSDERPGA